MRSAHADHRVVRKVLTISAMLLSRLFDLSVGQAGADIDLELG
jgi:hypothetical protein